LAVHLSSVVILQKNGNRQGTGKRRTVPGKLFLQEAQPSYEPVMVKKGCDRYAFGQELYPGNTGIITIGLKEDERVEIVLSPASDSTSTSYGYMIKGSRIQLLPIGSSPDNRRGIFYWQPGVGFLGHYRFVFVEKTADGQFTKKFVNMMITPKH
jgi:hypothetical protein